MVLYSAGSIGLPLLKGSAFNASVPTGDGTDAANNIFASDLEPTNSPTAFRIYVCFVSAGLLRVMRTSGITTVPEQLNGGTNLAAGAAYVFDIVVEIGDSINLQYSAGGTCRSLKVLEIAGAVS